MEIASSMFGKFLNTSMDIKQFGYKIFKKRTASGISFSINYLDVGQQCF